MNSFENYKNYCRICLDENVALNWNNKLFDNHGITYKDCYYKYTHLEYLDEDPFSPMLCENCLNVLQNIHVLVVTALDSHAYLCEKWISYCELNDTNNKETEKPPKIEFEMVLVEEVDNESITEQYVHENEELDNSVEENKRKTVRNKDIKEGIKLRNSCLKTENIESSLELEDTSSKMLKVETIEFCESDENIEFDNVNIDEVDNECITEQYVNANEEHVNSVQEYKRKTVENDHIKKFRNSCLKTENMKSFMELEDTSSTIFKLETIEFCESEENFEFDNENIDEESWEQQTSDMDIRHDTETYYSQDKLLLLLSTAKIETNKKRNQKVQNFVDKVTKKSYICSYCSKVFPKRYLAKQHERTHIGVRERREACNICGLKFFDRKNLHNHLITHRENREKRFKCEFCNKAFYNSGTRNIHRRIHLGQMIPCSLCSKKFFRQVDLERHMNTTHATQTINMGGKKYNKYYVRCKYCGKSIRSTTYKAHTAAHLKAPLMKCSICDREFYRRSSCTLHMKRKHHKTPENYNDFIICYTKNRISNLYLKQNAELELPQD